LTIEQTATNRPTGYLELVRENRNFRNLWFGQIVSLLGDWFNLIASAALVGMLTQSGLAVGGLFVVRMMAQFFASPIGGVLADRYNRKNLLIATDILRAFIVLGFLLIRDPSQVWFLYTLTAAQLALGGIFVPTRDAILPDVVKSNEIGAANALGSATWSTMLALGAALGGVVAGEWGLKPAFVIDSLTFIVSAFFISRVSYQSPLRENPQVQVDDRFLPPNVISQYAEGLRYLKTHRDILIIALQKASMALGVTSAFQIIQVNLAGQEYIIGEGGSTSLGIFYALVGIGTGIGPILARYFTGDDPSRLRRAIALGYLVAGLGLLIVSTLSNFGIVLFGTLLRGLGVSIGWVFSTQLLLQLLPNRVRGRVISTEFALLTLANAVGAAMGGWAFDNLSITISQMLWLMVGITFAFGLFWVFKGLLKTPGELELSSVSIDTAD
jgi:MFS family permease